MWDTAVALPGPAAPSSARPALAQAGPSCLAALEMWPSVGFPLARLVLCGGRGEGGGPHWELRPGAPGSLCNSSHFLTQSTEASGSCSSRGVVFLFYWKQVWDRSAGSGDQSGKEDSLEDGPERSRLDFQVDLFHVRSVNTATGQLGSPNSGFQCVFFSLQFCKRS